MALKIHQIRTINNIFQDCLDIEMNLKICQLIIEDITGSQSEYLARLMR
jgi:hypothetical protein